MPPRSKVALLPEGVRAELERRLIKGGFSGYRELADWLSEQGFEISKSSLHSWGQDFEDRLSGLKMATDQFKAVAEVFEAEEGDLADTAVQSAMINLQMANVEVFREPTPKNIQALGVATEKIVKAFGGIKKFKDDLRERMAAESKAKAVAAAEKALADQGGIDRTSVLKRIREEVYGMTDG